MQIKAKKSLILLIIITFYLILAPNKDKNDVIGVCKINGELSAIYNVKKGRLKNNHKIFSKYFSDPFYRNHEIVKSATKTDCLIDYEVMVNTNKELLSGKVSSLGEGAEVAKFSKLTYSWNLL